MYTLRLFKDVGEINREQIALGNSYTVKGVGREDENLGIKLRVFGQPSVCEYTDGICIYQDDHAFIMTESGKTFETLNRPQKLPNSNPKD